LYPKKETIKFISTKKDVKEGTAAKRRKAIQASLIFGLPFDNFKR
jgi:hypothetical protein